MVPLDSSQDDVESLITKLATEAERDGRLVVLVKGEPGSRDVVAVLPVEDRKRVEQQDPRFKGIHVATVTEAQAKALGIVSGSLPRAPTATRGQPPAGKRLTAAERQRLKKERDKESRRKKRDSN
jgi:hypothetical protein